MAIISLSTTRKNRKALSKGTILVVDDDRLVLDSTQEWLESQGFLVVTASSWEESRARLADRNYDLLLTDLRLEGGCGLEILKLASKTQTRCCLIAMTGYLTPELSVRAVQAGAADVLAKPLDDTLVMKTFEKHLFERRLATRDEELSRSLDLRQSGLTGGPKRTTPEVDFNSIEMQGILELVDQIADSRVSVLITGENGTGKSRLARTIHQKSNRRNRPFVEVACGSIPEPLLESELFGHTAGAFTGATHNKIGKFQYADSGTLFLDEIGTASMAMQVRLLRTLQNQTFEPIGSNETLRVDTRTIFATNENLEAAVAEGRFRQDLYYRIHVVPIELPPLRNRLEDLPKLADHFLALACQEFGREFRGFTDSAYRAMAKYRWPGNIRELENTIQRVALTCRSQWIDCDAIDGLLTQRNSKVSNQLTGSTWKTALSRQSRATADTLDARWSEEFLDLEHAMAGPERSIILGALEANDWNRNATALRLGINRTTLYKKMKRLGIDV